VTASLQEIERQRVRFHNRSLSPHSFRSHPQHEPREANTHCPRHVLTTLCVSLQNKGNSRMRTRSSAIFFT
jgi:hypothetical protein